MNSFCARSTLKTYSGGNSWNFSTLLQLFRKKKVKNCVIWIIGAI